MKHSRVNKLVALLLTACILLPVFALKREVNADSRIVIDGNYSDWDGVPVQNLTDSDGNVHQAQMFTDEQYLYLHVRMVSNSEYNIPLNSFVINLKDMHSQILHIYRYDDYYTDYLEYDLKDTNTGKIKDWYYYINPSFIMDSRIFGQCWMKYTIPFDSILKSMNSNSVVLPADTAILAITHPYIGFVPNMSERLVEAFIGNDQSPHDSQFDSQIYIVEDGDSPLEFDFEEEVSLTYSYRDNGISIDAPANSKVILDVDNNHSSVKYNLTSEELINVDLLTTNNDNELVIISIDGNSNANDIVIEYSDDEIKVDGLKDINVTIGDEDIVFDEESAEGDSYIVSVDKDNNTVSIEEKSEEPTVTPTDEPTDEVTPTVTVTPTKPVKPTSKPTNKPTAKPTVKPTVKPTTKPTAKPSVKPTAKPTVKPTIKPTAAPTKPADKQGVEGFCERLYTCALKRSSDPNGIATWVDELTSGRMDGAQVAEGFFFSKEFINLNISNEEYVDRLYRTFMGREADSAGREMWVGLLNSGEYDRKRVFYGFVDSAEWSNICAGYGIKPGSSAGSGGGVVDFATRLYTTCLNRGADPEGVNTWSSILENKTMGGTEVAKGFFFSKEFLNQDISNEEYVDRLYKTFMGREADNAGREMWVGLLTSGQYDRLGVFYGFAQSQEFAGICDSYGINP